MVNSTAGYIVIVIAIVIGVGAVLIALVNAWTHDDGKSNSRTYMVVFMVVLFVIAAWFLWRITNEYVVWKTYDNIEAQVT